MQESPRPRDTNLCLPTEVCHEQTSVYLYIASYGLSSRLLERQTNLSVWLEGACALGLTSCRGVGWRDTVSHRSQQSIAVLLQPWGGGRSPSTSAHFRWGPWDSSCCLSATQGHENGDETAGGNAGLDAVGSRAISQEQHNSWGQRRPSGNLSPPPSLSHVDSSFLWVVSLESPTFFTGLASGETVPLHHFLLSLPLRLSAEPTDTELVSVDDEEGKGENEDVSGQRSGSDGIPSAGIACRPREMHPTIALALSWGTAFQSQHSKAFRGAKLPEQLILGVERMELRAGEAEIPCAVSVSSWLRPGMHRRVWGRLRRPPWGQSSCQKSSGWQNPEPPRGINK